MANQRVPTKLISEYFIKPVYEPEESKQPHHLTLNQILFLCLHYMQRGLLFTKPSSFDVGSFLDKLKRSISIALVHFYPLAGQFVTVSCPEDRSSLVYLDCNKGPGAWFIHTVCSAVLVDDVVKYGEGIPPVVRSFFELGEEGVINLHGCCDRALLSVQVTELTDGLFIGFTMNHSIADGASLWHFANILSEIFKSINDNNNVDDDLNTPISHLPIYQSYEPTKLPYSDISESVLLGQVPPALDDQNLSENFSFVIFFSGKA